MSANYARDPDFVEIDPPQFYLTLLNESGDTAITWSEPDDVEVLTYIQKKMDEGYVFFIERPAILRAFMKRKKISDVAEVKQRNLIVADEDAKQLELKGKIRLTKLSYEGQEQVPVKKAKSAKEVAENRSYGTRALAGG